MAIQYLGTTLNEWEDEERGHRKQAAATGTKPMDEEEEPRPSTGGVDYLVSENGCELSI